LKSLGTATGGFLSGSALGFDVSGAPGQPLTYSSPIGNPNGGANALGVFKQGDGTLVLSGANTYTGSTTITRGALQFAQRTSLYGGDTALWTASKLIVLGGSVRLNVGGAGEFTSSDVAAIAALGTSTGGFQTGSRLDLDTTNAAGGAFDFSGTISNPNSGANHMLLGKTGTGTLILSGNSPGFNVDATIRSGSVSIPAGARIGLDAVNAATWTVGESTGDNGALQVAGTLYSNVKLGVAGTGAMTVQNGGLVSGTFLNVGDEAGGGTGTLTVNAGGRVALTSTLGMDRGTLNIQSGGEVTLGRTLSMNGNLSFQQVVNVTGPGARLVISSAGAGPYLAMWDGTLNVSGGGYVEAFTFDWDNGRVSVSGPGSLIQASHAIQTGSTGSLTIDNGGAIAGPNGNPAGTEARIWGTLNIGSADLAHPTTAGTFAFATMEMGSGSVINFNQTDPTVFGANITSVGKVAQRGTGTTTLTGTNSYSGGTAISGGTLSVSANANLGAASGKVTFAGGTLQATNSFTAARATTLNAGGGTFEVLSGATLTWNGVISGASGNALTKTGAGTLTLGGANPFTGPTIINAGTLALASGATLSGTASIAVASGATFNVTAGGFTLGSGKTLSGGGTVSGLLTIASGGHLAAGGSAGALTFLNGLTLADGAVLDFQLGDAGGLIHLAGGTLAGPAGGALVLNVSDAGGFIAGTYPLFDFGGAGTSSFDLTDFVLGSGISGFAYGLAFNGSTLELTATASAIPEPSTYAALCGAAALGLAAWRRRRTRVWDVAQASSLPARLQGGAGCP
jgi:fibronectin-binding autotransporter adhesin